MLDNVLTNLKPNTEFFIIKKGSEVFGLLNTDLKICDCSNDEVCLECTFTHTFRRDTIFRKSWFSTYSTLGDETIGYFQHKNPNLRGCFTDKSNIVEVDELPTEFGG